ncbi:MAG: hypothetical protein WKF75_06935 [Singulisphaera sp.]
MPGSDLPPSRAPHADAPGPLRSLDAETARRVIEVVEAVGVLPGPAANPVRSPSSPVLQKSGATLA